MKKLSTLIVSAAAFLCVNSAFAAENLNQYENQMIDKVWITTDAVNAQKEAVPSSDKNVNGFFGIAEYKEDGTFKMYTQEGKLKLSGDWSMSEDGKSRTLVAKKPDGSVMFTRTVENVTVEPGEYTYRIYPNAEDTQVYFDIIHKPLENLLSDEK